MRNYCMVIMTGLFLCGCLASPQTSVKKNNVPPGKDSPGMMALTQEPVTAPISLYDAMARAVKHNYHSRSERLKRALADELPEVVRYKGLADRTVAAGYSPYDRDAGEISATVNRLVAETAVVPEQHLLTRDLSMLWQVLDFGLIRTRDAQAKEQEIRQKALQNILKEARYAYYRAACAELLLPEINTLLDRGRAAIKTQRQQAATGKSQALSEAEQQLVRNIRLLWQLSQQLAPVRAELAVLMHLSPGTRFKVARPDPKTSALLRPFKPVRTMEHLALIHRQAGAGGGISDRLTEARRAILTMAPGTDSETAHAGQADYSRTWQSAGSQIALNLFSLFPKPSADKTVARDMAAIAQVRIARQLYDLEARTYRASAAGRTAEPSLTTGNPEAEILAISDATDSVLARLHRYLAQAELQNAVARIYHTVGADSLPVHVESVSVAALSAALKAAFSRWPHDLNQAYAAAGMSGNESSGGRPEPVTAAGAKTAVPPNQPDAPQAGMPREFKQKSAVVIDAADMEKKGRQPVKEVSVYRDVVSIHFKPSADSPVKGQGLIGEKYRLAGWSPGGWLKIEMSDGSYGWIRTKYVRPVDEGTSYAVEKKVEAVEKKKEKQAGTTEKKRKGLVTAKRANVRSGPGFDFVVKYVETKGVRHDILGRSGEWFKIRARDSSVGWLHQSIVSVEK